MKALLQVISVLCLFAGDAAAQLPATATGVTLPDDDAVFATGSPTPPQDVSRDARFQVLAGFSAGTSLGPEADFDYEPVNLRAEFVLFPDQQTPFLSEGDFTCLADLMIAHPENFGSIIIGPSVLVRKELRPSTSRLIPYAQVGGGMVYTDADNVQTQRVI